MRQELKDDDLPLLSSDINEVRRAANFFINIGSFLDARTSIELPRLKANGLKSSK
jgi:hypothetical protein